MHLISKPRPRIGCDPRAICFPSRSPAYPCGAFAGPHTRGGVGGVNGIGIFLGDNDASLARVFGGNWLRVAREVWQPPF